MSCSIVTNCVVLQEFIHESAYRTSGDASGSVNEAEIGWDVAMCVAFVINFVFAIGRYSHM